MNRRHKDQAAVIDKFLLIEIPHKEIDGGLIVVDGAFVWCPETGRWRRLDNKRWGYNLSTLLRCRRAMRRAGAALPPQAPEITMREGAV